MTCKSRPIKHFPTFCHEIKMSFSSETWQGGTPIDGPPAGGARTIEG